jgi:hypothetical protein
MRATLAAALLLILVILPAPADACDQRCVIGMDNVAYCKPANLVYEHWRLIADCEPVVRCHRGPNAKICYPDCDGSWCYEV